MSWRVWLANGPREWRQYPSASVGVFCCGFFIACAQRCASSGNSGVLPAVFFFFLGGALNCARVRQVASNTTTKSGCPVRTAQKSKVTSTEEVLPKEMGPATEAGDQRQSGASKTRQTSKVLSIAGKYSVRQKDYIHNVFLLRIN